MARNRTGSWRSRSFAGDVGNALMGTENTFFVGTEYQYWNNKLGTNVDESAFQFLGVWRF
jgi:hypothetical protein